MASGVAIYQRHPPVCATLLQVMDESAAAHDSGSRAAAAWQQHQSYMSKAGLPPGSLATQPLHATGGRAAAAPPPAVGQRLSQHAFQQQQQRQPYYRDTEQPPPHDQDVRREGSATSMPASQAEARASRHGGVAGTTIAQRSFYPAKAAADAAGARGDVAAAARGDVAAAAAAAGGQRPAGATSAHADAGAARSGRGLTASFDDEAGGGGAGAGAAAATFAGLDGVNQTLALLRMDRQLQPAGRAVGGMHACYMPHFPCAPMPCTLASCFSASSRHIMAPALNTIICICCAQQAGCTCSYRTYRVQTHKWQMRMWSCCRWCIRWGRVAGTCTAAEAASVVSSCVGAACRHRRRLERGSSSSSATLCRAPCRTTGRAQQRQRAPASGCRRVMARRGT